MFPALGAQNLNHRTAREVPSHPFNYCEAESLTSLLPLSRWSGSAAGAGTLSEPAHSRPGAEGLCKHEVWALWVRGLLLGWTSFLERAEGQIRR